MTASGTAELQEKILWKKLVDGQRPKIILPECCNCEEVLEGKVYMCQVGHKFCKTCLRKKQVESVDLTLLTVGWILLVGIEAWRPTFKSCCIDPSEALHKRTIQQPVTRKALVANTRIYLLSILSWL